jgi:hypothetical protein
MKHFFLGFVFVSALCTSAFGAEFASAVKELDDVAIVSERVCLNGFFAEVDSKGNVSKVFSARCSKLCGTDGFWTIFSREDGRLREEKKLNDRCFNPPLNLSSDRVSSIRYGMPVSPVTNAVCANGNPPVDGHCGLGGCVNDCGQLGQAINGMCYFSDRSSEQIN